MEELGFAASWQLERLCTCFYPFKGLNLKMNPVRKHVQIIKQGQKNVFLVGSSLVWRQWSSDMHERGGGQLRRQVRLIDCDVSNQYHLASKISNCKNGLCINFSWLFSAGNLWLRTATVCAISVQTQILHRVSLPSTAPGEIFSWALPDMHWVPVLESGLHLHPHVTLSHSLLYFSSVLLEDAAVGFRTRPMLPRASFPGASSHDYICKDLVPKEMAWTYCRGSYHSTCYSWSIKC